MDDLARVVIRLHTGPQALSPTSTSTGSPAGASSMAVNRSPRWPEKFPMRIGRRPLMARTVANGASTAVTHATLGGYGRLPFADSPRSPLP